MKRSVKLSAIAMIALAALSSCAKKEEANTAAASGKSKMSITLLSSKDICSQIFVYAGGVLRKAFFVTPGREKGFSYFPLYGFRDEEVLIDISHESLLDEGLAVII